MQAPRQPHVSLPFTLLFSGEYAFFFPSIFVPLSFFLCMESTWYVAPFRMVFFYLVTTGWIFDISLYVRIQSNQSIVLRSNAFGGKVKS